MFPRGASRALLAVTAGTAVAQFSDWQKGQISTEICTWEQPRAALIRDTIYLDGGTIWWVPTLSDGSTGRPVDNGNNKGVILSYNLSTPFDAKTNVTGILLEDENTMTKARGGSGNSNGAAPNFIDGGMLANDAEFFLYGGVYLSNTQLYPDPDANEVLGYQEFEYGPDKPLWDQGFVDKQLDNDVTRYVAYGAAVNAPSENKAWYFSGLRSPVFGTILDNPLNDTTKAVNVSDTMIMLDMAEQMSETWSNKTLPSFIQGRSNAEVVWVPVGKEGILVVLGGVVYPEWAGRSGKSSNQNASEEESPKFMSTIDIYDVAGNKWYQQPTQDGPSTRARGCAVVAPASDYSSFNIFYYGGFDGISPTEAFSDEVWVLSLPSFTWTKINEGKSLHGRAGHKCFKPYADQMMVLGGYTPLAGVSISCLDGGPVVLFNISSGEWMDSYDPSKYADYSVHEKIQSQIGGNSAGNATASEPSGGWATSALGKVFQTSYSKDKMTTYYPYASATSTEPPSNSETPGGDSNNGGGGGSGLPKWVAPVLGVVLGLMLVTGAIVIFCLYRRRKIFRNRSSDAGTEDAGMRIISWMRGQPTEKAPTVTTSEDTPRSPGMEEARVVGTTPSYSAVTPSPAPVEMADTQVAELADTSPLVELHDTGLSPVDIIQKHTHFAKPQSTSLSDPSYSSFSASQDHASTVSRSSAAANSTNVPGSGDDVSARVTSDLSGISETDAANLRRISGGPVSPRSDVDENPIEEEKVAGDISPSPLASPTPVSPPSAGENSGQDYLTARPAVSPLRKSVFLESEEDMGKK